MTKFKSTRDQLVNGEHVKNGATVEVEASRVAYLVSRGHLVEVETKKTSKSKQAE